MTISAFSDELAQVRTKKKEFLTQIERIVPWKEWLCLIQPCYYKEKKRDPDAHQVKKGNTWHFGYKAHIGVDRDSGLVHTVEATAANVHDATETSKLLTGDEDEVYGDSGYLGAENRGDAIIRNKAGRKIKYRINRRPSQVKKLKIHVKVKLYGGSYGYNKVYTL